MMSIGLTISPNTAYNPKLAHERATGEAPFLNSIYTIGNIRKPNVGETKAFAFKFPFAYKAV